MSRQCIRGPYLRPYTQWRASILCSAFKVVTVLNKFVSVRLRVCKVLSSSCKINNVVWLIERKALCRCGYTGSKPAVQHCISAWHIIPPNNPPYTHTHPLHNLPLASLGSHYRQPGSSVLHRGCPWRAYPNCDSLLRAQVNSSPWNHSGGVRGRGSRVVINMVQAQLMSHSKSLILADILCCSVET